MNQQTNGSELKVLKKVHVHQSHSGKQILAALSIMSVLHTLAPFAQLSHAMFALYQHKDIGAKMDKQIQNWYII